MTDKLTKQITDKLYGGREELSIAEQIARTAKWSQDWPTQPGFYWMRLER